jgi:hypothetical protein
MSSVLNLPTVRFLDTLTIVAKEGKHLSYSWNGLFTQGIAYPDASLFRVIKCA